MSVSSFVININKNLIKYGNIMNFKYGFVIHAWVTLRKLKGFDWLTYSMEQSPPWQANSSSASQEISYLSWNSKVQYHVHKSLPLIPILSQMKPVHILTSSSSSSSSSKIHYNINLPPTPRSSNWCLPFWFTNQNVVWISHLFGACCMPCQSYTPWFYHHNNILILQVMKLFIMQFLPFSCYFLPPRSKPSP